MELDGYLILDNERSNFCKLITCGMGAYPMHFPPGYPATESPYMELMIWLPKGWPLASSNPDDNWPLELLFQMALVPKKHRTWLAHGHTLEARAEGAPVASNTQINSVLLTKGLDLEGKTAECILSSGKKIQFLC